jgi:hypothetical protein
MLCHRQCGGSGMRKKNCWFFLAISSLFSLLAGSKKKGIVEI